MEFFQLEREAREGMARIGKYRLIRELGRGGMGVVYLAEDTRLERQIALKVLHPFLSMDGEFVRRFTSEARAIAALAHKGIVRIHAFEEVEGSHLIDMEYIEGGALDRHMREGHLSPTLGLGIAVRVFEALAACHAQGIIHRDVKPSNILLADDGRVLLTDFGLARSCAVAAASTATSSSFIGTPKYAAPESWGKEAATPAGDVYSAALVLLELLAGRTPYDGDSPLEIMRKVVSGPRTAARHFLPDASNALVELLDIMLHPEPSARPTDAGAALTRLRDVPEVAALPEDRLETIRVTPVKMRAGNASTFKRSMGFVAALVMVVGGPLAWLGRGESLSPGAEPVPPASDASTVSTTSTPVPTISPSPEVNNVFQAGEHIVFTATVGGRRSLWSYHLNTAETEPIWPELAMEPEDDLYGFQPVDRGIVAVVRSPINGHTLFSTDGTPEGTQTLAHVSSWHNRIVLFGARAGSAYMCRVGGDNTHGIWKTDGSLEGTRHIWGGVQESIFTCITTTQSGALFATSNLSGDVHYFRQDTEEPIIIADGNYANAMTVLGEQVIVERDDGNGAGRELWAGGADGGPLHLLKDFIPGPEGGAVDVNLAPFRDQIVISVTTPELGRELWITDGTAEGTRLLCDINPGSPDSRPNRFVQSGALLYFCARDQKSGDELWATDGTTEGTRLVRDIAPGWRPANPHSIRAFKGGVIFTANDGVHGEELWLSDGTESGTRLILDCMPGPTGRGDFGTVVVEDRAVFSATHPTFGRVLWQTDGTAEMTQPLFEQLAPREDPSEQKAFWGVIGSELLMTVKTPEFGNELWVTNLTTGESNLHRDIRPGPEGSNPRGFVEYNGTFYFVADDGTHGDELWSASGNEEYTKIQFDAWEGKGSGNPRELTVWTSERFAFVIFNGTANEICYFENYQMKRIGKPELIKSNWDPFDLKPGAGGWLYFSNRTASGGTTIWRTDGVKVEQLPGPG